MNRLALIAVTGVLALSLTACGEQGTSKPADNNTGAAAGQQNSAPNQAAPTASTTTSWSIRFGFIVKVYNHLLAWSTRQGGLHFALNSSLNSISF